VITLIADRIKNLRESQGLTQAELAKKLGITRSSVNAWEMGISTPQVQYIVELSNLFKVSSDFILGIDKTSTIDVSGLSSKQTILVLELIGELRAK
jgi:transcriptional regulator with XRE-family HTH domain